ncbi:MAG TPA: FAD/NAD(P)-binding protein [Sphingomicrobium sp.]|nr:FAD/NAD(P)-binding protein [Sphingomicrobium sp.]
MTSDRVVPVAIIGGGFSGTILAAQLARRGIRSALIDGSGRMGRGTAYSTSEPAHLLNVRAEGMSAWAGQGDHFAKRFEAEGGDRRGFAERRLFGRYIGEILDEAVAGGSVELIGQGATRATRADGGWRVELEDGGLVQSEAIALAVGNQEPEPLSAFSSAGRRFIRNPWGADARDAVAGLVASGGSALLVGTGLTTVDLVLSLEAAGHRGKIMALSRRGLIPRSHADFDAAPVELDELPEGDLLGLWRWLRKRGAHVGWRAAIDSLRPHSRALWQGLGDERQRRFLRHARPWWDVHRHRIAPEVARTLARLIGEGRLEVIAGRIISASETGEALEVDFRRRGSRERQSASFAYAFNCTGPLHSIARSRDPLLRSLFDTGAIRADHLGIGLDVDDRARAGERAWALGPLTKGRFWEIIAVPDIREQAAAVADDIQEELGR